MSLRTAIARWLAPEAFKTVERYHYLRATMEEMCRWCAYDFPVIDAAVTYAKVTERNHFRKLEEPSVAAVPGKPWIWNINDFRKHLRDTYLPKSESVVRAKAGTTDRPTEPRDEQIPSHRKSEEE